MLMAGQSLLGQRWSLPGPSFVGFGEFSLSFSDRNRTDDTGIEKVRDPLREAKSSHSPHRVFTSATSFNDPVRQCLEP